MTRYGALILCGLVLASCGMDAGSQWSPLKPGVDNNPQMISEEEAGPAQVTFYGGLARDYGRQLEWRRVLSQTTQEGIACFKKLGTPLADQHARRLAELVFNANRPLGFIAETPPHAGFTFAVSDPSVDPRAPAISLDPRAARAHENLGFPLSSRQELLHELGHLMGPPGKGYSHGDSEIDHANACQMCCLPTPKLQAKPQTHEKACQICSGKLTDPKSPEYVGALAEIIDVSEFRDNSFEYFYRYGEDRLKNDRWFQYFVSLTAARAPQIRCLGLGIYHSLPPDTSGDPAIVLIEKELRDIEAQSKRDFECTDELAQAGDRLGSAYYSYLKGDWGLATESIDSARPAIQKLRESLLDRDNELRLINLITFTRSFLIFRILETVKAESKVLEKKKAAPLGPVIYFREISELEKKRALIDHLLLFLGVTKSSTREQVQRMYQWFHRTF